MTRKKRKKEDASTYIYIKEVNALLVFFLLLISIYYRVYQ